MDRQKHDELRRELALEQAIGTQLDKLVCRANEAVLQLRDKENKMEESQLRNLLNAAMESGSIEVTAGFIRYQIGRDESRWEKFGHHIIRDLGALGKEETVAVVDHLKQMGIADAEALKSRIQVRLMQLYLGYINRAFVYARKANGFDHLKEVVSGA